MEHSARFGPDGGGARRSSDQAGAAPRLDRAAGWSNPRIRGHPETPSDTPKNQPETASAAPNVADPGRHPTRGKSIVNPMGSMAIANAAFDRCAIDDIAPPQYAIH
jgi:hypothetical protein